MKPPTSIFRRKDGPDLPRRRPVRSLATSFAWLETRALLTWIGPILPLSSMVQAPMVAPPLHPFPTFAPSSSSMLDFGGGNRVRGGDGDGPGPGSGPSPDEGSFDRIRDHVALSAMPITVNGLTTPEIALADAGTSEIRVRIGSQTEIFGPAQGIDHPQSVLLAYLSGNSGSSAASPYPDLIVANSGADNILVFPGLPGGQFGPALNGFAGLATGRNPVSVSVADVNGDGVPDLLVANRGSDTVTIFQGSSSVGSSWTTNTVETISVGDQNIQTSPVKVLFVDPNRDGVGDILVCNSGSNDVYVYHGLGNGSYDVTEPTVFNVGLDPSDMLLARFDRRSNLDLITVNSGSNDLTFINGVLTANPTTLTISSGGLTPDAAVAFSNSQGGALGLMVANSGDGRLAFLQPGLGGLQITGVASLSDLPIPTGLAAGNWGGSGIELFAATAGQDAADLLRFDLGIGSTLLATPADDSIVGGLVNEELIAGLMPLGDSLLELIAVFRVGSPEEAALVGSLNLRETSSITSLYSPTKGQGDEPPDSTPATIPGELESEAEPTEPGQSNVNPVHQFVTGDYFKLNAPRDPIAALAARDLLPDDRDRDRDRDQVVRLDDLPVDDLDADFDPDAEAINGSIGEALRLQMLDGSIRSGAGDSDFQPSSRLEPGPAVPSLDTSSLDNRLRAIPLVSSVALLSTRLILKASPPRPPSFHRGNRFLIAAGKPRPGSRA